MALQRLLLAFLLLWTAAALPAQQRTLRGKVTGQDGEPLIGATVLIKDTGRGTATEIDGTYELRVPDDPKTVLTFSYTGMKAQNIRIGDRTRIDVVLIDEAQELGEVVVTAYAGPKREKDLVGSFAQVDAEQLRADRPIESVDKLLEGQVAGVQVELNTGEPGLPVRVRVRGEGSLVPVNSSDITASGQPLFVLDGVPLYDITETNSAQTEFSSLNDQRLNPLLFLNPNDIESITVLKDAAATSIYGANAANGVVLITTKGGRAGKTRVNFSLSQGFSEQFNEIQFLNTEQYVALYRETLFNSGLNPANAGPTNIMTDWRDLVTRTGSVTNANLSIDGGKEGVTYRFSSGYFKDEAISEGNSLEKLSTRLNLTADLSDRLQLSSGLSGNYAHKESFNSFGVFSFPPNIPPILADGNFNNEGFFANRANPLAALAQNEFFHDAFSINGNVSLNYQLLPGLKVRGLAGVDLYQQNQFRHDSALNGSGRTRNGFGIRFNRGNVQWIANLQASYNATLGERHHLNLLGGTEATRQSTLLFKVTATNFPFDNLRQLGTLENENTNIGESRYLDATRSFYGQAGYNFDYRYYLSLSTRRDASSIFGGDVQAANFFALGAGWAFSEEAFLEKWDWLGFGKLRGSYGLTGNSRLGTYSARGLYRFNDSFGYGGSIGLAPSTAPNDSLSWETKRKLNLGVDLHFLEDRLKLTVEYYNDKVEDAISTIDVPRESGFDRIIANAASMRNWGWEFSVNTVNLQGQVRWTSNLNLAFNRNRVLDIAVERPPGSSFTTGGIVIGEDVNTIYGVRYAGVDPYNGKGLFYLADGSITDDANVATQIENRLPIGKSTPTFYGGFQNQWSWRGLSASLLINYSYGSDIIVNNLTFTDGRQIEFNNQSVNQLDRWQQPGELTDTPRLHRSNEVQRNNTRYLFDNSYLKFANLSLSWQVPARWLERMRLRNVSVSAQVNNLGYLYSTTSREGRNSIAEYRFLFPEARSVMLGLQVGI